MRIENYEKRLHISLQSFPGFLWENRHDGRFRFFYTGNLTKFHGAVAAFVVDMFEFELLVPAVGRAC